MTKAEAVNLLGPPTGANLGRLSGDGWYEWVWWTGRSYRIEVQFSIRSFSDEDRGTVAKDFMERGSYVGQVWHWLGLPARRDVMYEHERLD